MMALLVSMAAYVPYAASWRAAIYTPQQRVVAGCLIGLASAIVGKVVGILLARRAHRRVEGP
jgi:hypothetical protein